MDRALVGLVVHAKMGAQQVFQLELGQFPRLGIVRQQDRATARPEKAIAEHHRLLVAGVPVRGEGFGCHY